MKKPENSFAMAYSMKNKTKKKMAKGGLVDDQAKSERHLMPSSREKSATNIEQNSGNKALVDSKMTDQPERQQSMRGPKSVMLSRPPLRGSDSFSVRYRDEIEDDLRRMQSEAPSKKDAMPKASYDDKNAQKQGPSTPDLKLKMMAKGGLVSGVVPMDEADEDELEEGMDKSSSSDAPPVDEYMASKFAAGGFVDDQYDDELQDEHDSSIAAAIMARKRMAEGGVVTIDQNAEETPSVMRSRNFAALKENYDDDVDDVFQVEDSNEEGDKLDDEDENSMSTAQKIMRRMSKRSPMTR